MMGFLRLYMMELNNLTIKEYVRNIIRDFPINEFKKTKVDYLGNSLFSFSFETIPDVKVLKRYTDGSTIEQYKFLLVSTRLYTNDDRIMLENSGVFEMFSNWLESLVLIPPKNANFKPVKFETLGHVFINDNDTEQARYTQEIKFIYQVNKIYN